MAKANYMAKVNVSGFYHWMAFPSVLWGSTDLYLLVLGQYGAVLVGTIW